MSAVKNYANSLPRVHLVARVLSIPILAFTLFMIFGHLIFPDTEPGTYPPIENLLPVLMTLSVLGLGVAWWRARLGGVISLFFFMAHLGAYWIIRGHFFPLGMLIVFTPVVVDSVLFLI